MRMNLFLSYSWRLNVSVKFFFSSFIKIFFCIKKKDRRKERGEEKIFIFKSIQQKKNCKLIKCAYSRDQQVDFYAFFCCCCIFPSYFTDVFIFIFFIFSFIRSLTHSLTQCEDFLCIFHFHFYCESFYFMNEFFFFFFFVDDKWDLLQLFFSILTLFINCYCEWIVDNFWVLFSDGSLLWIVYWCLWMFLNLLICRLRVLTEL